MMLSGVWKPCFVLLDNTGGNLNAGRPNGMRPTRFAALSGRLMARAGVGPREVIAPRPLKLSVNSNDVKVFLKGKYVLPQM
jgi:hypothetical protein